MVVVFSSVCKWLLVAGCQADLGPTKSREPGIRCELIPVEQRTAAGDIGDTAACAPPNTGHCLSTFTLVNTICLWLNMKRCGKVGSRIKCTHVRNIYPVTSRMWVDIISIYSVWNCENISNSEWDMPPHCCMKLLENVLVDRLTAAVTTWSCAESEDDGHTDTRLQLSFVARQQSAAIHSGQFTAAI